MSKILTPKRWSKPASIAFSLLFIAIMCFALLPSPVQIGPLSFGGAGVAGASGENWLTGYSYRVAVTIGNATGAGTNYQVKLLIGETSGATGENFDLAGHTIDTDWSDGVTDLKFTDNDGNTSLDFWWESTSGTGANELAIYWVEVADSLESVNAVIYCYYGKTGDTYTGSGSNTFLFFDDFDDASIDTDKWTVSAGVSEAGGVLVVTAPAGDYALASAKGKTAVGTNVAMRARATRTNDGYHSRIAGFASSDSVKYAYWAHFKLASATKWASDTYQAADSFVASSLSFDTSYHIFETFRNSSTNVLYRIDNTQYLLEDQQIPTGDFYSLHACLKWPGQTAQTINIDWSLIRKCIATEPAFSSVGGEEPGSPSVTTISPVATSITTTTATLNGNVTSLNSGGNATVRGFKYGLTLDADTYDIHEDGNFGTGAFDLPVTGLSAGTLYYVRAYATNPGGTSYGASVTFFTSSDAAWLSGWKYRIALHIATADVDADCAGFPVTIFIDSTSGKTLADATGVFDNLTSNANRKKIAVTQADGTTELYVEIEKWDDANEVAVLHAGNATGWTLPDAGTILHFYYDVNHADNTTYVADCGNRTEIYKSTAKFVNHLADWNIEAYKTRVLIAALAQGYLVMEPDVMYRAGETHPFKMWVHTGRTAYPSGAVEHFYSDDGSAWTYVGYVDGYVAPSVPWNPVGDSKYWMYASLGGAWPPQQIDLLTSSDETAFSVDTANVLHHSTDNTKFDYSGITNTVAWYEDTDSTANLTGNMTDSADEIVVSDTTKFAATQYIKVESEWMLVTAITDGTHADVTRAQLGTSAVAHTAPLDIYKRLYYLWYGGINSVHDTVWRSGLATAYDGKTFTKQYNGSGWGGAWDFPGIKHGDTGGMVKVDGVYYACNAGNWINTTDMGSDITAWFSCPDILASPTVWTPLGGTAYQSFISRTQAWEGVDHADGQTADLQVLVDNNGNPVTVGGYSFFYYTALYQQAYDINHPCSIGLVKLPGTFSEQIINGVASMCDSTSNNNDPDQLDYPMPATGQVGNGRNWRNSATGKSILRFPDSASHDLGTAFTFAASVYVESYVNCSFIFNKDLVTTGNRQFAFHLDFLGDNSKYPGVYFWDTSNNLNYFAGPAINLSGGWHRVVCVKDASNNRYVYIDGTSRTPLSYNSGAGGSMQTTTQPLYIGYRPYDSAGIDGNLDELVIMSEAVSAAWAKADNLAVTDALLTWGSAEEYVIDISNTPSSWSVGVVQPSQTYWSNGAEPGWPLEDADCWGNLTNNSSFAVDILASMTSMTGGTTWSIGASPDTNIFTLKIGIAGLAGVGNFTTLSNTPVAWITSMAAGNMTRWTMVFYTPTNSPQFADGALKSGNMTFEAEAS